MWDQGKASSSAKPLDFAKLRRAARQRPAKAQKASKKPAGMPAELIWSPQARDHLVAVYTIGPEQPQAAERYFDRVEAKTQLLITHPKLGAHWRDVRRSARVLLERALLP